MTTLEATIERDMHQRPATIVRRYLTGKGTLLAERGPDYSLGPDDQRITDEEYARFTRPNSAASVK